MSYCINRTVSISSDPFAPSLAMNDSVIWLTQTNIVSCSDTAIAPLVSSSARQLTGLTLSYPSHSRSTDVRSNVTENEILINSPFVVSRQTVPFATNKPLSISRYGISLMEVSVSAVTNTVGYDALGRQIAYTDGRGNVTHTEYNAFGQRVASIDALGNRTTYTFDQFGNLASVINSLGNAIVYEYDLRGRKTYEGGATYPVRYTYDDLGNKVTMMTYRDEKGERGTGNGERGTGNGERGTGNGERGDVTTWLYDEALGVMTNKVYADGKGPTYSYTPDGKLSRRTWARGITTDYSYDNWGNLTNTAYSDNTPTVSIKYDALGRQTEAHDAAGVTTFLYDSFCFLTNETVIGVAGTNTIERYWDDFGRNAGYAHNSVRQTTIGYEPDKGRISTMGIADNHSATTTNRYNSFSWTYLDGSDLKSSLTYPNGLTASWQYDSAGQLLQVCNATPTNVISQYDYTYDPAGRRVACGKSGSAFDHDDSIAYCYNARSELTNAVAAVDSNYRYAYDFDEIGNRESSSERGTNSVYASNQLNQYTAVDDFTPEFDDDGNQTLIKTATGVWQVCYNAEDRPVLWTSGITNIVMSFDQMGRRTEYLETTATGTGGLHLVVTNIHHRFVYDGYLCVRRLVVADEESGDVDFVWDPTEPAATRTLVIHQHGGDRLVATHDGGKNVSELVFSHGITAAHYEYSPFGELIGSARVPFPVGVDFYAINPFLFSSEYYDSTIGLVYYNYRHYSPSTGRWLSREKVPLFANNSYAFLGNVAYSTDMLGLYDVLVHYYLMYALMRELGYTDAQAQEIAAGSQYPDTREWDAVGSEWDAVYERFRPNTQRLEYRELFHNLNSLDCCGILAFRRCLAEKIDKEETLFLKGVYLHTLADTYAHLDPRTMCSYGREDGHMDDGFAPDDVQWVRNGEEIGRERLYGLLANIKEALGKENVDTPDMDAFLKKLYEHNYLFFKSMWWYFYTPSLQIPQYARDKGLRDNIDPNNSYGDPLKNDKQIRDKVLPNLKECLDRARKP